MTVVSLRPDNVPVENFSKGFGINAPTDWPYEEHSNLVLVGHKSMALLDFHLGATVPRVAVISYRAS
jgi:hypothetical protein